MAIRMAMTLKAARVNAGLSASNSDTEAELLRQKTLILDYISSLATYSATDDQFTIRGVSALTEGSANISAQMYAAGVIGYLRAQKLERYLESINQKK